MYVFRKGGRQSDEQSIAKQSKAKQDNRVSFRHASNDFFFPFSGSIVILAHVFVILLVPNTATDKARRSEIEGVFDASNHRDKVPAWVEKKRKSEHMKE